MRVFLKNGKKYSFSPDQILENSALDAYELISKKKFTQTVKFFYKNLGKLDKVLKKKKISIGLKRSIVNEIFVNSGIFFFIYFFTHKKIKNKIAKIEIVKSEIYLKFFLKDYFKINLKEIQIKKRLKYNRLQILKQLNKNEIKYYIKKKINRKFKKKVFDQIIYKECPLLINKLNDEFGSTLYIRDELKNKIFKLSKEKLENSKDIINCFNEFINTFSSKKIVKKIIIDLYNNGKKNYVDNFNNLKKDIKKYNIKLESKFHTSQLTSAKDFALMDLFKEKYNSKIITYQHGHGQGLSEYHDYIKFLKETSYSDLNHVFSKNGKEYNSNNNSFSISKTVVSKFYYPYNKTLTKLNSYNNNFDIVYFSPWHMNGINHSLYNYGINDFEKIKIESKLIKNYLSKTNYKILIKKYPYDSQKYNSENYIKNLVANYKNLTFYNKTLKYPEFYQKKQIILLFGCSSTFGYLASFHNPIIMVNLKNYFPVKKKLEEHFKKSIFLVNHDDQDYKRLLQKLVSDKKYIYEEWEKKTIYREMFYKKFLGIY